MSKLLLHIMTSLDGYYAGPDGELDWHYADAEHEAVAIELLDSAGMLLFGRITYEMMAEYWPTAPSDPIADRMNALPKAVISATLKQVAWNNTRLLAGNAIDAVRALKRDVKGDIALMGSGQLAAAFAQADLIDEYHIMLCPIFLGGGKSLFANVDTHRLESVDHRRRNSGVVDLRYRRSR